MASTYTAITSVGEPRQQSRLDQRRLAAARRSVDQADREGIVGIRLFDASLPEPEAVGQSIAVARAGSSSRKKSASWASKDRKPFGTILMGGWSEVGVAAEVPDRLDRSGVDGGCKTGVIECVATPFALEDCWLRVSSARKCRRSSAMSFAVDVPLRGALGERFQANAVQFSRDLVVILAWRAGLKARHLLHHFVERFPRNGCRPTSNS